MKVYLSSKAETKLLELAKFLIEKWSHKVKAKFFERFNKKVKQISIQPNSCPKSKEIVELHKCVVTKQTTFYYRVIKAKNEIEIITIFDSRQNPNKLFKDVNN
ncbi:MAG: type II toxin-antitoxin system RelE/ParE family toxin [Bacteroidota bacterium]